MIFSKNECEDIINLTGTLSPIDPYSDNGDISEVNYSAWKLLLNDDTKWIFDRIGLFFTSKTNLKIKKDLNILYIHKYIEGQRFGKHNDINYKTQIHNVGVCLNDDYEGGEFILYNPDETLPKVPGTIYTFPSIQYHEVKEITKGEMLSIIGFIHIENIEFTNTTLI
jgi:hypothetical protein